MLCISIRELFVCVFFFFFKQKTAYEMRISDWSSDVCSSDLLAIDRHALARTDLDDVAGSDVGERDFQRRAIAHDARGFSLKPDQPLDRLRRDRKSVV